MPNPNSRKTLRRLLIVRVAVVAIGIAVVLVCFTFAKHLLDTPALRRATLEADRLEIIDALKHRRDPISGKHYTEYPNAYGLRIFQGALPENRRLVAEVNSQLFPAQDGQVPGRSETHVLSEGFELNPKRDDPPSEDRWMLTDQETVGEHSYWLQLVMVGDPAWRWRQVIADEILDDVIVPVAMIVPALLLAMLLSIRLAAKPLERIAREAAMLGSAVATGDRLKPLNAENLPMEFYEVVQAINGMLAKLEQALQQQKQFTSNAAHELRTPLAVLLLQLGELPPGSAVDNIRDSLEGVTNLVDQLLHLAQAEQANEIERQPIDVASAARKACEDLAMMAYARRQTIEFEAPDYVPPIVGHPALIETAIRNVISNAVKYSTVGAAISVSVDSVSNVTVADRGPGIRDEHKALIFSSFWRADRSRSDGAGIGLALVRRIADLHGGDIRVEDRSGGGTRFTLSFTSGIRASPPFGRIDEKTEL